MTIGEILSIDTSLKRLADAAEYHVERTKVLDKAQADHFDRLAKDNEHRARTRESKPWYMRMWIPV